LSITFAVEMDHQIMKVAEETKRIVNGNIGLAFCLIDIIGKEALAS
jgi:hypothetical protein